MSVNIYNVSFHCPFIPTTRMSFTHISAINCKFQTHKRSTRCTVICSSPILPKRNSSKFEGNSEAQELVRTLLKNFNYDKPLLSTLKKYVKLVNTEHCFLLFEELGKSDKWLQRLKVSVFFKC